MSESSNQHRAGRFADRSVLDQLAADLEGLRIERDSISYTDLADRISRRRENSGLTPAAARVARSTVYDVFRPGRSRVSPDLIAEIVLALTGDELEAERWRRRAVSDMASTRALSPIARPTGRPLPVSAFTAPDPGIILTLLIVFACFALNNLGGQFVADLGVPLYLDMVGTAIAAVALGPWHGVAAGLANNVLGSLLEGSMPSLWFALVNVVGALIWGYGVRVWRLGRDPLRFFLLNIVVAFACSIVAVPVLVLVFGGSTGHTGQDAIVPTFVALGAGLWGAVFSTNILISILDKLISGYVALFAVRALAWYGVLRPAFGEQWLTPPGILASLLTARNPRGSDSR